MEAFLVSTGLVALAEIGDKTQLLAFMLAARFRRPLPIIAGILVATLANHALAGALGTWLAAALADGTLRWLLGASFLAMAGWCLIPDEAGDGPPAGASLAGVFGATVVAFFVAEMGDKTQVATVMMAAHYGVPVAVVLGTTLGMLLANVPAVIAADRLADRLPMKLVRTVTAAAFALLGLAVLFADMGSVTG